MKVIVVAVPNSVSEKDLAAGMAAFAETIGMSTRCHILTEDDAIPQKLEQTEFQIVISNLLQVCGNPDNTAVFKNKLRNAIYNHGNVNVEMLKILIKPKTMSDKRCLNENHLGWLPDFAKNMYDAYTLLHG